MKQWTVKVLYLGKAMAPKSALTPGLDSDVHIENPMLAFLLQSEGRNILVDSGGDERFLVDGKYGFAGIEFHLGRKYLDKALQDCSVSPEEIDTVIYTHLHNDHTGFSHIFRNARIIVQKKEWELILNPLPCMLVRKDFDFEAIPELKQGNLALIDGDLDIADGVRVFTTPGHTSGHQAVAVHTRKGIVALVGDHFHLACMAFPRMTEMVDMQGKKHKITPAPEIYGPFYPSSVIYNYYDWYDSSYKIKAIVDTFAPSHVICGHEPSLVFTGV